MITDDLAAPVPLQKTLVAGSATLNGVATGVTVVGNLITADYSTTYGPLAPGASATLRFRVTLAAGLAMGTVVTNTGVVSWNIPPQQAMASVSVAIGGMPGVGTLSGSIWHDQNFDNLQDDPPEINLVGWFVDLYRNGVPVLSAVTDVNGDYRMTGVAPNATNGDAYMLRFRAPDAGANTAALGRTESPFTNGLQEITNVVVPAGSNLLGLSLPIDPGGVVYESVLRTPLAGATLTLLQASTNTPVSAACFDDPRQQGQVTGSTGYYKFDLNFSDGSCPAAGGDYLLAVTPPGAGFEPGVSAIIPPQTSATTLPFDVPSCPGSGTDAIGSTAQHCEVQIFSQPRSASVPARDPQTDYHLHLSLDASQIPGTSQLFNNHIPLDPVLGGAVSISKTTPRINVSKGDLVPYQITFNNSLSVALADFSLRDDYPAGFRYIEGSARYTDDSTQTTVAVEPTRAGRSLTWTDLGIAASSSGKIVMLLAVGAGVSEGEFVNRVQSFSSVTNLALSGQATATVRVVPDPTFDCTDVIGKVYDDANHNGYQDEGEKGLPDVRVMSIEGLGVHTDPHGRFHITCAIVPNATRGSNFILKVDDRTLPSGYRMTTRQTQVLRATRGKALKFSFGASIHRVVGLDLADAVFEPGTSDLRTQWKPSLAKLLDELAKSDAILRLTYIADIETKKLVDARLRVIEKQIREAWAARGGKALEVESEIFWRRGGPVKRPAGIQQDETSALESTLPHVGAGPPDLERSPAASGERILPSDAPLTEWVVDPAVLERQHADTIEEREVMAPAVETVKLKDIVPPIRFESGVADISPASVEKLRKTLDDMQHLANVRLHLVGHADDQPLSQSLATRFGDNEGLSKERAGEVAEHLQRALALPPESIAYEWAGDARPIAPNTSAEGRAKNRRVEVEVWYDVVGQKSVLQDVVVPDEIRRFKVCRTERVCKLSYKEGEQRRARVKNLIPPLEYQSESIEIPEEFVRQVAQALENLGDKQNVTVKFIAHTDDTALEGRAARIYGTPLALSRARVHRVALAIKDRLSLATAAIASDGFGDARPVASNATPEGRAKNRRIEVEFWHDDPLLELPDELQTCPDEAGAETVTRVYDPPWGKLEPLAIEHGKPVVPADYTQKLRRAMDDVAGERNVRLRFVGYTRNEHLTRRMADVYGDDIGLSASRARRTLEMIQTEMGLEPGQVEHQGRGFVHSDDVVNGGFFPGETDHVVVQVVYDEDAIVDDYDGVEVTPIVRELRPRDPLALNLMRITVDGEPIDDPGRSSADIQRCTDVALDRTEIAFRFDDLASTRRLSVTAEPKAVVADSGATVRFRMYNNYPHFIERSEVRVFRADDSTRATPLAVAELDEQGFATWAPDRAALAPTAGGAASPTTPSEPLMFVVRAYDKDGKFRRDGTAVALARAGWLGRPARRRGRGRSRAARGLRRIGAQEPEHRARKHGRGARRRHRCAAGAFGLGRGATGPRERGRGFRRRGSAALRAAHRRGRGARRGRQRRALPARPGARSGRLVPDGNRRRNARPGPDRRPRFGARRQQRRRRRRFRERPLRLLRHGQMGPATGSSRPAPIPARARSRASSRTSSTSRPTRSSAASTRTTTTRPSATTRRSRSSRRRSASSSSSSRRATTT